MKDPDLILYQLNYYKPLIDRAINLTRAYVSTHKLILTGGMSIDLALRAKGQSIYDDDTLPDYDIISDQNLIHANALAEIMCKEGLPDINVINAVHITTVRVRMKNIVFLDATYIPPSCMEKIPYLDVDDLRIVHPHYQFIDQRLSLATLLADTGISLNVFNRLKKDVKRNSLLRGEYPIQSSQKPMKMKTVKIPLELIQVKEERLEQTGSETFIYTGPSCVVGYLGYHIMTALYNNTLSALKITEDELEVSIPDTEHVRILSCAIVSLSAFIKRPKMYRPLINLKPISQVAGDYEYVDSYGSRISCNIVNLSDKLRVCVGSVDYLLMEMLRDRIYINDEPYSMLYTNLVSIVDTMRLNKDSDPVWWPSLNCYGITNLPEYRVFALEKIMNSESAKSLRPKNSYPLAPKCATKTGFQQEDSHYFRIDGREDATLDHSSYLDIIKSFHDYLDKKRSEDQ